MALQFRKRIRLFSGVHLNLGKRGVSISVGPKGLTTNLSRHGITQTVGIPGTGISYRKRIKPSANVPEVEAQPVDSPSAEPSFGPILAGTTGRLILIAIAVAALFAILAHQCAPETKETTAPRLEGSAVGPTFQNDRP
jgi:hypothetical protein